MSWKDQVDEIFKRRTQAKQQGGPEGVARQHEKGRLTIRERIDKVADSRVLQRTGYGRRCA